MIKSMEQVAEEMLELYMSPLIINGIKIFDGWPAPIAAKKAIAAHPNFENEISKIALKYDVK